MLTATSPTVTITTPKLASARQKERSDPSAGAPLSDSKKIIEGVTRTYKGKPVQNILTTFTSAVPQELAKQSDQLQVTSLCSAGKRPRS